MEILLGFKLIGIDTRVRPLWIALYKRPLLPSFQFGHQRAVEREKLTKAAFQIRLC
jgi:hypothetical protein